MLLAESSSHSTPYPGAESLHEMDVAGFAEGLERIRVTTYASLCSDDFKHLRKIESWGRISSFFGYATAWIIPNPLSAFALSLGQFTRWLLAHHILHKGYDQVPGVPDRYRSKGFARGWRRFIDWFDWIHPSAWDYEHNILHHYHTGEDADPDLVEKHVEFLERLRVPKPLKYALVGLAALTWKFTYYAPNTMSVLDPETKRRLKSQHIAFITIKSILNFKNRTVRELWLRCYLPYSLFNFAFVPLLFLPLGQTAALFVLLNKILAELITNVHSFLVIGPNHTADDLHRFHFHYQTKEEFYVTQVLGSANYNCGKEWIDYLSIWLNYQIEHHLFPDLPMTKYREVQPQVKALCERCKIPYRQESIFKRFKKMLDVCVGNTRLKALEQFPIR